MSSPCDAVRESEITISDPAELDSGAAGGLIEAQGSLVKAQGAVADFARWWQGEWGPGPLVALALPLVLSTGFTSLMLFTDRTLLYWQSGNAASSAMGAGTVYWALMCLPTGMLSYLSTFVSQYLGAGRPERVSIVYRHALRLAWMVVPFLVLAFALAGLPFWFFDHPPELRQLESTYLRTLLLGGVAVLFYSVQSGLMTGAGHTGSVLLIDAIATLINLVLSALLIFGIGPIPAMGVLGAGLATAIAFWLKLPIAYWIMHRRPELSQAVSASRALRWEPAMLRRLVAYGAPSGLQMLSESAAFTIIMLQVGRLGGLPMAATTLALGLNVLAFVPMMGLGIGVGVLVGNRLLQGRIDLATRTVVCALWLSLVYTGAFAILLGFFPDAMTQIYAFGSPERFTEMRPVLLPLLQIIAVYCVLDGFQIVFVGAIKGAGDTWFVLLGTAILGFGSVGAGLLCEQLFGSSLMLWWYIIAAWVGATALVFGLRFWQGKWKTMQVIEAEPVLVDE
ncbi:MAG: MATE family efflux transporter [Aureliella sp.]